MAKIVAFEWDSREARFVIGSPKGNEVVADEAFSIELASAATDETPTISEVKEQIAAALAGKGLTGSDALLSVPRSSVELRTLNLPQAPPEEIPDLVRFQAMQAFTSIGEDWPLDFIELDAHGDSLNVLAAIVSPQLVKETRDVCDGGDLRLQCLVLRPFAAVSLLQRFESIDVYRSSLIVDVLPEGADLTAISNGHVVFMRSVRLPATADQATQAKALLGELRRTIGAAQNQMGGSRIEQVVICGDETAHATLHTTIDNALSLDVIHFNPFEAIRLSRGLKGNLPEHAGRFAPLLGMLVCHGAGTGHTIDFLNPRRRPDPPNRTRRNAVFAATAAAVVLLVGFVFMSQKNALDDQIEAKRTESKELDALVTKAQNLVARVDRIRSFEKEDITWLDELRRVANKLPNADSLILDKVVLGADRNNVGGFMVLQGNVAETERVAELEEALRYGRNRVEGKSVTSDASLRDYPYRFTAAVYVPPDVLSEGHSKGRPPLEGESAGESESPETVPAAEEDSAVEPAENEAVPDGDGQQQSEAASTVEARRQLS